jgi:hypothetical protein
MNNGHAVKYDGIGRVADIPNGTDAIFDDHGGKQLHWPGSQEGYPFRGNVVPHLKQQEMEELPRVIDFHCFTFYMWDESHQKAFAEINDRIANTWYQEMTRHDKWVDLPTKVNAPDGQEIVMNLPHLIIYLEWAQIYNEIPQTKHPAMPQM